MDHRHANLPLFYAENGKKSPCILTCSPTRGIKKYILLEETNMEHIVTLKTRNLCESAANGGCGECQTSCQSACKTSCGIANQKCENTED